MATPEEEFQKTKKLAEGGNATAQCDLGVMHAKGIGVVKDAVEAAKRYTKAAEQGLADAQYSLGLKYASGESVSKDASQAVK